MTPEERLLPHPTPSRVASRVSGYLVEWDKPSDPIPNATGNTHVEIYRKGCFARSVLRADIPATLGSGSSAVRIGCKSEGKLKLKEDDVGLWYEVTVPAAHTPEAFLTAKSSRLVFALRNQQSDRWSKDMATREILDVDLNEIGLVF